ncbi:hypothetical protein ACG04R_07180 [Roseateles sp. BYS78W]|uniref:Uncharacterized protein n=1 Tax=Pelomonas candidula TaxID=3299025 RepID=A0ABW7H9I2_9BURK
MSDALEIDCPRHGRSQSAAVCGHVVRNEGPALGFVENSAAPDDKQGWCYACELVYLQEQDKSARFRAFVHHSMVCVSCYDEIKAHHDFDGRNGTAFSPP